MKGVVLAGGLGTRLYPLTHVTNKHLLPVYNKPMIFYPIETLVKAGIDEIMIVTSGPHVGHFLGVLKNGKELGVKHLEYSYQEKPDGGIADALSLAENFADGESIAVILGDNTTDADISNGIDQFTKQGAMLFLKEVENPHRFGVADFVRNSTTGEPTEKIKSIIEKPKLPPSNYAVTGLYLYDNTVFQKIKKIDPSHRGELEITDVNNLYIEEGTLRWVDLRGFWSDAGTFESLYYSSEHWAKKEVIK